MVVVSEATQAAGLAGFARAGWAGWLAGQGWLGQRLGWRDWQGLAGLGLIGSVKRKFRIPVPDPRLPGPGAGPATRARCRMPAAGLAVFRFISPEKILKITLRTPGTKNKSKKKLKKMIKIIIFCSGRPAP